MEIWRYGEAEIWRYGDMEIWRNYLWRNHLWRNHSWIYGEVQKPNVENMKTPKHGTSETKSPKTQKDLKTKN